MASSGHLQSRSMSEFQKDELSLEETNKLRISLGLKPLVADDAPSTAPESALDADAQASRNHQNKVEQESHRKDAAELSERLAKAQAKREAARRLRGPTLAEPEASTSAGSSTDTLQWLKESRKRAKAHAARRAKEIQEEERARENVQYGESDLAGLRVAHNVDEFDEGEQRILTLKDSDVLDDATDQLLDATLDQKEQDKLNADRKKGLKQYSGLDDEEAQSGRKRGVLSKYDADLGPDRTTDSDEGGFRLGVSAPSVSSARTQARQEAEEEARFSNRQLLSLDYDKNQNMSDYLVEGDIGFKKPKVKKRKNTVRVKLDMDDPEEAAASSHADRDIDMNDETIPRQTRTEATENFVDDDDLQASLAKARRQRAKKTFSKITPKMIARNLAAQREAEEQERAASSSNGASMAQAGAPSDILTFDETNEFVRAMRERPVGSEVRSTRNTQSRSSVPPLHVKSEDTAAVEDAPMEDLPVVQVKTENMDDAEDGEVDTIAALNVITRAAPAEDAVKTETEEAVSDFDGGEPMVGKGLAGTLSFLRNQGMLPQTNPELQQREQSQQQYDAWLAARRWEEADREASRQASKASGSSIDQATREAQNRHRELEDARKAQDRFRDYKPDVEIKYHDEFGRDLDQKEAWKHLSHVFHGKMPGTKKMEKRLKKIEDERKRAKMAAGETPTGMMGAFQTRSERTGQAHMVLSVGNKGSAPQQNDLLSAKKDAQLQLQKPASTGVKPAKVKNSKSERAASTSSDTTSVNELASVPAVDPSNTATTKTGGWTKIAHAPTPTAHSTSTDTTATGSTTGFKPVSATDSTTTDGITPAPPSTNTATPFKMSFGLKRKTSPNK